MAEVADNVVNLAPAQAALRDHFLGWQCRLRQIAMRKHGGRPTAGMRPRLARADGTEIAAAVTVLIVPAAPEAKTQEFRHLVRRTHDPRERYDKALALLAATHYQRARDFGDTLTALFGADSAVPETLTDAGYAVLSFAQYSQRYRLVCRVRALGGHEPAWQHTYWHNSLFNPAIPPEIAILAFTPDWARAWADPPP